MPGHGPFTYYLSPKRNDFSTNLTAMRSCWLACYLCTCSSELRLKGAPIRRFMSRLI
jgi:hypothetical protein